MAAILIVDDDKNIRSTLTTYVETLGHMVETAADAAAALAMLNERQFDIVLSDISMAGMSGLALLREIRRQHGDVAVVLMTAYATVPQAIEAMHAGAYEYLTKPFSPDDVRLLINHILDVQILRRETTSGRSVIKEMDDVSDRGHAAAASTRPPATDLSLRELERRRIEEVLAESPDLETAAERLGIDPSTLWRKRRRYGLD